MFSCVWLWVRAISFLGKELIAKKLKKLQVLLQIEFVGIIIVVVFLLMI